MDLRQIVAALRHCGRLQASKHGKSFHSHLIKTGFSRDIFVANNLIYMYVDLVLFSDAQQLFDEMPERNTVTWTTMVSAYVNNGRAYEALRLYGQMLASESHVPNGFLYSTVLKACAFLGDLELGRLIHEIIFRDRLDHDVVLMNALLDMYVKCGSLSAAKRVFNEIPSPNSTSWNTIISGYCKAGLMDEALNLFHQMPEKNAVSWNSIIAGFVDNGSLSAFEFLSMMHRVGLKLDVFTLPCVLKSCSCLGSLTMGEQIHCYALKSGLESSCFTVSALMDMYSNFNVLNEARNLFNQYTRHGASICNSLALWNSMLSGYVVNKDNIAAIHMLSEIYFSGTCFDCCTFSNAVKLCINVLNFRLGCQVHGLIVTYGYGLDMIVGSILIDLYAKLGSIRDALRIFHRLPAKDIIAWSGLIGKCAKVGFYSLGFVLFRDMVNLGLQVDQFVISSILKICSSLASLGSGKQVHAFCVKSGYESEEFTVTSLIDMYSKCGDIDPALVLFYFTPKRDIVSWTGMIVGCGQNGRAELAVEFFHEMKRTGLKPNEVTLLSVLSACRHTGLVEQAWIIFKSMKPEHGIDPLMEHYHCMVDILGQAGRFQEAEELIAEMPFEPNKTIWGPMLVACGIHKNTKLVPVIAKRLIATSPLDPSLYVMLANVYATLGMWDSLDEVRRAAKELDSKEIGMSWIET
ncbi:hypothetical protein SLA2020_416320 [Shorea laevis]